MSDGPTMRFSFATALAGLFLMSGLFQTAAQDVRGLEICTAEKNMERRTGCLQANIDFLQQRLNRIAQDAQQKQVAAERELAAVKAQLAAAQAEIAALKEALAKLVKAGDAQKPATDRK